jgi:hypothetical protein
VIDLLLSQRLRPLTRSAVAGALLSLTLGAPAALAQTPAAKPSLLQRIRQLIGLNRPIAAGGSRSSAALAVCVITPRTELDAKGQARALVPLPRPTILAAGPLNEVRIDRDGQPIWRQRASSTTAIEGPISWPLEPIGPGEQLTLLLRPRGASGGDFARIELTGASASEMEANQSLVTGLGGDAKAWLSAVDSALDRQQVPLAWALLFAPQDPRSNELDALRREVLQRGCGGSE